MTTVVAHYGATGYEGIAYWNCSGGMTSSCSARLNTHYTQHFSTNVTRLKIVWGHELGHCFGLHHSTVSSAVMYTSPSSAYLGGTTTLRPDDVSGMNSIY